MSNEIEIEARGSIQSVDNRGFVTILIWRLGDALCETELRLPCSGVALPNLGSRIGETTTLKITFDFTPRS